MAAFFTSVEYTSFGNIRLIIFAASTIFLPFVNAFATLPGPVLYAAIEQ
jgi:hypothetical protein